ncbi:hypothetical protein EPH95_11310 [Salicibibacter halophilus]|uniref:YwdI family protein n=1 Tax=Salicibibacter halophilus TaxID=2502791 RepID=A0A514LIK5_9BACI|nr:DUF5327 family protein [Salicibibacter halophilus]QDI91686.1 hypothetical protein EPH95_11310 [Salicibibacter halophilus]
MHVSAETIVAKIKQETANLELALENGEAKGKIREHARLIRAFSELIEEGGSAASGKSELPVTYPDENTQPKSPAAVQPARESHEVSGQGNLLEF